MIPLSLYIHIPWCIQKCPYCDFNSHKSPNNRPEADYVDALIHDLRQDLVQYPAREIESLFIGGGTPSLFSASAFDRLLNELNRLLSFKKNMEITLEANPGTIEQQRFNDYRTLGINRLSLGIQSFNPHHLKALGRIHDDKQAQLAIKTARLAGFDNINLDIMHGLPNQTILEGLDDLTQALTFQPEHLSWYQLTIEPNTVFYKKRPILPSEDDLCSLEDQGLALLEKAGLTRYEISAFCQPNRESQHNLNYWLFGDYYGIGAGAHGKLTLTNNIWRTRKLRQPNDYLVPEKAFLANAQKINNDECVFEFMLNATRLQQAIPQILFCERTGLSLDYLMPKLVDAQAQGFIHLNKTTWQITPFGRRYTNDLQALFLPD